MRWQTRRRATHSKARLPMTTATQTTTKRVLDIRSAPGRPVADD